MSRDRRLDSSSKICGLRGALHQTGFLATTTFSPTIDNAESPQLRVSCEILLNTTLRIGDLERQQRGSNHTVSALLRGAAGRRDDRKKEINHDREDYELAWFSGEVLAYLRAKVARRRGLDDLNATSSG